MRRKRPCREARGILGVEGGERCKNRVGKGGPLQLKETRPVVQKAIEKDRNWFILRSVGDPGTPSFTLGQPGMPISVTEGRAMSGGIG